MDPNSSNSDTNTAQTSRTDDSMASFAYTNKNNASLKLLNADFESFLLFLKGNVLKKTAMSISRCQGAHEPHSPRAFGVPRKDSSSYSRGSLKLKSQDFNYFILDNFFADESCINGNSSNKHCFLESFRSPNVLMLPESEYQVFFSEFEKYLIRIFSIHPTLGSKGRGAYIDEDKTSFNLTLSYIRFYESAMHLLSQKQHFYFHLSLFVLIVLLRNLRRFLHHYKSNSTFLQFVVIVAQGIWMCQKHLYETFVSDTKVNKGWSFNKYTDLLKDEGVLGPELENNENSQESLKITLKALNEACLKCKVAIQEFCKEAPQAGTKVKQETVDWNDDVTVCNTDDELEPEPESEKGGFESFYEKITPMMTRREESVDTTLDYDKSDISNMSTLNLVIDDQVNKWISELCKQCNLYCRIGNGPVLMRNRFTKLAVDSETSVLPKLCKTSVMNLSALRSRNVKMSMNVPMARKTPPPMPRKVVEIPNPVKVVKQDKPIRPLRQIKQNVDFVLPRKTSRYNRWSDEDVKTLLIAVNRHGLGNWTFITKNYFLGKKSPTQLKDKWTNLTRYRHVKQVEMPKKMEDLKSWILVDSH